MPTTDLALFQTRAGIWLPTSIRRASFANDARGNLGSRLGISGSGDRVANWSAPEARFSRYAFLHALADNTAYSDAIHPWSQQMKSDFDLSPNTKPIFNPFGRLREFWATHLYSGTLDPDGGDGKSRPSSVPIESPEDSVREPIARILEESRWDIAQTVYGRLAAELGDVGLFSVNDVVNRRSYVEVIHPESIVDYRANALGEGTYYLLKEYRDDPRPGARVVGQYGQLARVLYLEQGWLEGGRCHFRTYLQDGASIAKYAWDENQGSEWAEDYPFLPLEVVPYIQPLPACPFGESEAHGIIAKIVEHDDIASLVNEAIRKYVDPVWMFAGVRKGDASIETVSGPGSLPAVFSTDPQARAQALLASIPFADIAGLLDRYKQEIIDDKPELDKEIRNATGDASGVALRTYQQRLTTKGQTRRAAMDARLVSALKRCLRMNALMGYEGFEEFTPERIAAKPSLMRFRIAERPLFRKDELDALIVKEKQGTIREIADRAGIPINAQIRLEDWSKEDIAIVEKAQQDNLDKGLGVGRQKQASPPDKASAMAIQAPGGAAPSL